MNELPQDGRDVINLSNGSKDCRITMMMTIIILITMTNKSNTFFFRTWLSWFLLRRLRGRMKCEGKVALQNKIFSVAHFKWGVITNVTHNNVHPYYLLLRGTHPRKRILMLCPGQKSVSSVYATAIAD